MNNEQLKIKAAEKALEFVKSGMRVGIGTGSTANAFIKLLAQKVAQGLLIYAVPTSIRSDDLCNQLGIKTYSLEEISKLDLTIDGADEIDPSLTLIKGGGGALLREKIVAYASEAMIVIADESKLVKNLGAFALPIEVNSFGYEATKNAIKDVLDKNNLPTDLNLRQDNGKNYITDGGHYIIDASLKMIKNPQDLSVALLNIPGVVEHGLFVDIAKTAIVARAQGTIEIFNVK